MKKGCKPRKKKTTKKIVKKIVIKDNTFPSFMHAYVLVPPPSLVPHPTIKMIDMAHSHCPLALLSISIDIFASS